MVFSSSYFAQRVCSDLQTANVCYLSPVGYFLSAEPSGVNRYVSDELKERNRGGKHICYYIRTSKYSQLCRRFCLSNLGFSTVEDLKSFFLQIWVHHLFMQCHFKGYTQLLQSYFIFQLSQHMTDWLRTDQTPKMKTSFCAQMSSQNRKQYGQSFCIEFQQFVISFFPLHPKY